MVGQATTDYNPIFQRDESELGLEDMDTVDDEEDPDSGSNEQGKNSEPAAISVSGDIEEAKSQDCRRNSGANEKAAATIESKTGPQQLQMVEVTLVASVITDIEEGSKEGEHPDGRREVNGKDVGDGPLRSTTSTTRTTEGPQNPDPMHVSWATARATAAAEKQAGLLQFRQALRQKLKPKVWTSAGALEQWLSGRNKRMPCRKLTNLDPVKTRAWIGPGQFISFIKDCDFVIWKQGEKDIEFSRPDPNPVTGTSDSRRVATPPPSSGPVRKPLSYSPLRQNPTDVR
jgi:hypothetical protein